MRSVSILVMLQVSATHRLLLERRAYRTRKSKMLPLVKRSIHISMQVSGKDVPAVDNKVFCRFLACSDCQLP